ncbi:MAG: gamma-glutamyltransferase [Cyclobacteriaceae bacterium]
MRTPEFSTMVRMIIYPKPVFSAACMLLAFLFLPGCQKKEYRQVTGLLADSAMVVCAHPAAAEAGLEILKKGGNAIDAAVATELALMVGFPEAGNIGGGGFLIYRDSSGNSFALDFREKAPKAATTDMYLDKEGNVIPGLSISGHLASGVPGTVDGLFTAHKRFGKLPWKDLVEPSINLAENGIKLTKRAATNLNRIQDDLRKYNSVVPEYLLGNWKEGDLLIWSDLAVTLQHIRDRGRDGFYTGPVAESIINEMKRGKGIISFEDLQNYRSRWLEPITGSYRGLRIISMPPPSSGGIALLQLLKSVEPFDIKALGHNTAAAIHLMTEAERRVYADRAEYLGDPDFYPVPVSGLIDESYNRERMKDFNPIRATPSALIKAGNPGKDESEETTHISIVDKYGNAVSLTTTLNEWFGNKVVVGGSGFFLNDEMDDFSSKPGVPNMFGLIGGEANKIEPGKTMLSAMTPTIIEKGRKLFIVAGTPGGSTIITSVFQIIMNVTDHEMTMQQAVNAHRVHSQWLPDLVAPEDSALTFEVDSILKKMGHTIKPRSKFGRVAAIMVRPDKKLEAGADSKRGDDTARGY